MAIEYRMLACAIVLGLVHIMAAAHVRTRQYGVAWNMGARDEAVPAPAALVGRLLRAQANFFETFPLFAAAVLAVGLAGRFGWETAVGAQLYVAARVIYLPVYAAGIARLRTLVFLVSMVGFVMVLSPLLRG